MTEGGRKSSLHQFYSPLLARRLLISARAIESNVKKVVRNETGGGGKEEEEEAASNLAQDEKEEENENRAKIPPLLVFLLPSPPVSHIAISNLFPSSPNTAATLTSV